MNKILVLLWFVCAYSYGQTALDVEKIKSQDFHQHKYHTQRNVTFGITNSNNGFVKYNPLSLAFSGLMYFYQKSLSPQISAGCLYEISCSTYSQKLFKEYGFIKGIFTSADRLMRCNRITATTINPIVRNEETGKVHDHVHRYKIKEDK